MAWIRCLAGLALALIEGADGVVATVGVVDVDGRVGVLGEYARVGFAVNADSVSDSKGAARLLDARLRRGSSDGYGGGVLRVSEGVRRSLCSGEGVSVALSVVARDGSGVVLGDGDVRRVLRGRPVASEWDVDSVLGSCQLPRWLASRLGRGLCSRDSPYWEAIAGAPSIVGG